MKHCTVLNCLRAIAGLLSLVLSDACWALEAVDIAAIRQQFVQDHEPADAMTLAAVREILTKNPGNAQRQNVVVAGRIGARGIEPFLENKASFVLLEIPTDDHAAKPGHDDDNCPFCKKRNTQSPMAAVQFVDKSGKVVPIDARKLFGIQKGRDVVVSGEAVFDPKLAIPIIQLTADHIFIRQPIPHGR